MVTDKEILRSQAPEREPLEKWHVYILLCQDTSLYTGIARDVLARFQLHKEGKGAKYTRSHPPVAIVYQQEFSNRSEALKREAEIKSFSRKKKLQLINQYKSNGTHF